MELGHFWLIHTLMSSVLDPVSRGNHFISQNNVIKKPLGLFKFHPSIHLFVRIVGKLDQIPAGFECEMGYTLDRSPVYRRVNTETNNHPYSPLHLWAN